MEMMDLPSGPAPSSVPALSRILYGSRWGEHGARSPWECTTFLPHSTSHTTSNHCRVPTWPALGENIFGGIKPDSSTWWDRGWISGKTDCIYHHNFPPSPVSRRGELFDPSGFCLRVGVLAGGWPALDASVFHDMHMDDQGI